MESEREIDPGLLGMIRTWWKTDAPVERFRTGNRRSPAYDLECALDHVASSVAALTSDYRDGKRRPYREPAAGCIAKLNALEPSIPAGGKAAERQRYGDWIAQTRSLLAAIAAHSAE